MSDGRRRAIGLAITLAAAVAACHNYPVDNKPPLEQRLGVYHFAEHVVPTGASESMDIEGNFVVFGDTVTVDARPGPCRLDTRFSNPSPFTYDCGGVQISFDRRDPIGRAMYSVVMTVTGTRLVCVRYATDASGRRYCAEQRTEATQRQVTQTGRLRAIRPSS